MSELSANDYLGFLVEIKTRIRQAQNLWYMRQFYSEYQGQPKLQPLVAEISWAKNLVILARCKYLLNQTNFDQTLPPEIKAQAVLGNIKALLK